MRQSTYLAPTLRDVPNDADVVSHQLMLRAGLIRQSTSGVYSFLPLGMKVLKKVEEIIREEMNNAGGQEMLMPSIQPAELWQESGRWDDYGPELMRVKDRHEREFALGPTHEEVITSIVKDAVNSYKRLPMNLYQIQTKFRDERRPRFGVLRGREFLMKDAYSFDTDFAGLDESYQTMYDAYTRIFTRCGLDFRAVVADSGAMGGKDTHEFMVLTSVGEDTIAYSDSSEYAANIEIAEVNKVYPADEEAPKELTKAATPGQKTIEEVAAYLNTAAEKCLKTILTTVDEKPVLILVRGDHEINDVKIKHHLDARSVEFATETETKSWLRAEPGYLGPVDVPKDIPVIADHAVKSLVNAVCGANETDVHFVNVNPSRDFRVDEYADVRMIQEGDPSPDGQGTIRFKEGIEVGHVFKLGTKYSEALGATYLNDQGKSQPIVMGSYGIGVSRTVAAIIEQHHDEDGIIWPSSVAPFDVHVIPVNTKQEEQKHLAEELYSELNRSGWDVLLDDRQERPGVKFKDADLFGMPLRITVGKRAAEGYVEVKVRRTGEVIELHRDELTQLKQYV
ncbi:proline--tRNA ligase [Salisediminibacterium halotolerans]|uniref:proline--tRNA ligase n=1 Tax=Salisediminibacterium halotolerans TaxID=517425 RepID=UPI000EB3392E|nr:proline--tRNA ligase [Salisediminibacterium halotolerans]RLJ74183.1 prolyl-tRNA synthetase [Actinophytocola xinjiangensis]RPE87724.1 prolyl-tRNA synthetase [Salisediminibacterium halotolerans]TWG35020.1 prolyl-tRNA synthetase [Salisediminibacterium halotolerans]GEL06693.1 proline--tRNA ligase 1 [Salisediminibacterium halotolerans]